MIFSRVLQCRPFFTHAFKKLVFLRARRLKSSSSTGFTGMKFNTDPHFQAIFTPGLKELHQIFLKHNHEIRIAGGAVRDLIIGIQPKDVDFATTATPDEMKDMFTLEEVRIINAKGEKHGTVTARIHEENFEVTTLRIDVITDGRRPTEVEFTKDWQVDAERRDLTINSMFLSLDGHLFDYHRGYEDLMKRRIAFVGDAATRIREDYLRILRYFRFFGRISPEANAHEETTLTAIRQNLDGLSRISGERIWVELKMIITGNHADSLMACMHDLGIFPYLGLPEGNGMSRLNDVISRCKNTHPKPMTLLSTLLKTEDDVTNLVGRVKMSREEKNLSLFLVSNRDSLCTDNIKTLQDMLVDAASKKEVKLFITELLRSRGDFQMMEEIEQWNIPHCPVNGNDLMNAGIKPSPRFKKILQDAKDRWKSSNFTATKEELLNSSKCDI